MHRRLVLAVLPLAVLGFAVAPSSAAPKAMKGEFDAAGSPDPSAEATAVCQGLNPTSRTEVPLKLPAAGKLKVELTGFEGDWDLAVENAAGEIVGESAGFVEATTEIVQIKVKKASELTLVACNFAGGPVASGTYSFIPGK